MRDVDVKRESIEPAKAGTGFEWIVSIFSFLIIEIPTRIIAKL